MTCPAQVPHAWGPVKPFHSQLIHRLVPLKPHRLLSNQKVADHLESLVSSSTLVLSEAFPGMCPYGEPQGWAVKMAHYLPECRGMKPWDKRFSQLDHHSRIFRVRRRVVLGLCCQWTVNLSCPCNKVRKEKGEALPVGCDSLRPPLTWQTSESLPICLVWAWSIR